VITAPKEMKRERYELILAPGEDGDWRIASEEKVDEITGLVRFAPEDEKFYRFDSFSFEAEGMKVTSGPGVVIVDYIGDELGDLTLEGEGLAYSYEPPRDELDFYSVYRLVQAKKAKDLKFDPDYVVIAGTPKRLQEFLDTSFSGLAEASRADLSDRLRKKYEDGIEETKKSRKENPFGGFRPKFDPRYGRDTYGVSVHTLKGDRAVWLAYDNFGQREVTFGVAGLGPLFSYYSEATRKAGLDPRELEVRADADSRFFDVTAVQGTVELGLKDPETMVGDVTFEVRAHLPIDFLDVFLAYFPDSTETFESLSKKQVFKIKAITDDRGNDLSWVQYSPFQGRIVFPESERMQPGERRKVRVEWENPKAIRNYSYSFKGVPRGGWLPLVRIFDLIDTFDLTVKTPAQYEVLGIGKKVSESVDGDVKTTRWVANTPVTFPSIIYGDYVSRSSTVQARKLDGTPIPVTIHVDKQSMADFQIRPKQLVTLADQAASAINVYTKLFQLDYPYDKLDLVNDPVPAFYGQAPSSLIYLGSPVFRGIATIVTSEGGENIEGVIDRTDATYLARFMRSVVAHETGHQWWGARVSNANSGNYWFVESLAEYSSAIYLELVYGKEEYEAKVKEWRDRVLEIEPLASVQNASIMWGGEMPGAAYQAAVYNKGPYAMHILRKTFGDEKFFRFFRALARTLAGKQIVTRDIQRIAEAAFGGNMDWFFDQWIRGVGTPEFRYDLKYRQTEDGQYLVEGTVWQRVVLGKEKQVIEGRTFRAAVPVVVQFRDGSEHEQILLVEGPETKVRFKVPKRPKKLIFNGGEAVLAASAKEGTFTES
ncbi:MAG: hypothetical protein D6718_06050, partial [Acidobacteria bacterium]